MHPQPVFQLKIQVLFSSPIVDVPIELEPPS